MTASRLPALPILVLSARTGSQDKVAALELGAVEYITKPFDINELVARLRAAARRAYPAEVATPIALGDVLVDLSTRLVTRTRDTVSEPVHLTPTEWRMVNLLLRNPSTLVTSAQLLTVARGDPKHTERSYLRIYMQQLRRKLEPIPSRPRYLLTEPGMGYRYVPCEGRLPSHPRAGRLSGMARGALRIYLGAAPGVGKTLAMLDEGARRAERGTDVVVAFVECHDRARTTEAIGDLEVLPRRTLSYRGAQFTEMDVDAVLARKPELALVDEFAHTNVPGSRSEKRWQDVELLLADGIDVISTLNIQHLESLNDLVARITGVPQRETVPDGVVRAADQIQLVDQTPEALRRRMAHGNIYAADKVDAALANYFRVGNLSALRELALLWVADRVDEGMQRYRTEHDIDDPWETRERVVVALTGGAEGGTLIRRAAGPPG